MSFYDRDTRPATPQAKEGERLIRRRIGFGAGQPIIETFDAIPQKEAEAHLQALLTNRWREGKEIKNGEA